MYFAEYVSVFARLRQRQPPPPQMLLERLADVFVKEAQLVACRLEVDEDERDDVGVIELLHDAQLSIAVSRILQHAFDRHLCTETMYNAR